MLFDFNLHVGAPPPPPVHRGFKRSTFLLLQGVIISDPSGCSVWVRVLAKISLEDTGCPEDIAGGHFPNGQEPDLEGEAPPEGGMAKASGLPIGLSQGRVLVLPPPTGNSVERWQQNGACCGWTCGQGSFPFSKSAGPRPRGSGHARLRGAQLSGSS